MTYLKYGMIKGRHELPVTDYIFEEDVDQTDFWYIKDVVSLFIRKNINSTKPREFIDIDIYVTGLSCVLAEIISQLAEEKWRMKRDIVLNLYHFDRDSGKYIPQRII